MDFELLKKVIEDECKRLSISEYEIYYESKSDTSVEMLKNEISGFTSSSSAGICLRLVYDGKMGYASSELMDAAEAADLVSRAIGNAKATGKVDTVGIFEGSKSYDESRLENNFTPLSTEQIKEYARAVQSRLYAESDKIIDGTQSGVSSGEREIRIVNSNGLNLSRRVGASVVMAQAVVSKDGENEADYSVKNITEDLSLDKMVCETVKTAISKIGAGVADSGIYPAIISGKQMRSLLSVYSSVFNARNVQMGMSLLKGKIGEKIASDCVNITDDPCRTSSSVHFDAEGVATYRKSVVENGVLKTFLHNRESAMKDGVKSTANASKAGYSSPIGISPYVFCIEAGALSFEELCKKADNGVYITEIKGLHAGANAITGDFSLECAGYRIESGTVTSAIKSFTIAGNFFQLLNKIDSLSDNLQIGVSGGGFTTFGSPDVLVMDASIAGK